MWFFGLPIKSSKVYNIRVKLCRYCKKEYPEEFFGVALTTKDKVYHRHKCKDCYKQTKKRLLERRKSWIDKYKSDGACIRCGIKDYRVLDFHHPDGNNKEFSISSAHADKYGLERIKGEIKKCVLLCANCHRIVHIEELKNK